jgi:hypothetical protein
VAQVDPLFFMHFAVIKPNMEEHSRQRQHFDQEWKRMEREHEEFKKKHGFDRWP